MIDNQMIYDKLCEIEALLKEPTGLTRGRAASKRWARLKEISADMGSDPAYISAILQGKRNPSARLATKLEQSTGIPREVWAFGTGEEREAAFDAKYNPGGQQEAEA